MVYALLIVAVFWEGLFPVTLWGTCPSILPVLVCLVGLRQGSEKGAWAGLFGGLLLALCGEVSPNMGLLTLLGGVSGEVSHNLCSFWGKSLAAVAVLFGYTLLGVVGQWIGGAGVLAPFAVAVPSFIFMVVMVPLGYLLVRERETGI